jgi:hypothetical protein
MGYSSRHMEILADIACPLLAADDGTPYGHDLTRSCPIPSSSIPPEL